MKKKLVILTYDFPPTNGGIARLCSEIAEGMHLYYESVEVITRDSSGPNINFNPKNFTVKRFSEGRGRLELSIIKYLKSFSNKNTDILCGLWHPEATLALLAGHRNVFVLGHGTEFLHAGNLFRKYFWLGIYAKIILRYSRKIIANSNYTNNLVKNINRSAKVVTLPLAVNEIQFSPQVIEKTAGFLNIASLSRIYEFKGYDTIARAIAGLSENFREKIHWNIGGTGPYLPELKRLVEDLGIANNVNFLGYIKNENLSEFYSSNDVFVLCTKESAESTAVEGFGLVFLEAQSSGVAVVGTNTGGIPDAVKPNKGGWLINQNDDKQLAKLFCEFINDPNILENQGIEARNRVLKDCTFDKYRLELNKMMSNV